MAGAPIGNKNGITHGMSKSRTYTTWSKMKARCINKNANGYEDYGGIGIKVCNRWINSFEDFLSDMGERDILKKTADGQRNQNKILINFHTPIQDIKGFIKLIKNLEHQLNTMGNCCT